MAHGSGWTRSKLVGRDLFDVWVERAAKDPAVVPTLCRLLRQGGWESRRDAAMLLGRIGDRRAVPDLIHTLGDGVSDVRVEADRALCRIETATAEYRDLPRPASDLTPHGRDLPQPAEDTDA